MTVSHTRTFVASVLLVLRERQSGAFRRLIIHPFYYDVSFFLLLCFLLLHNETFGPFIGVRRDNSFKLNTLRPSSAVGDSARRRKTRCCIACGSRRRRRRRRIDDHAPVLFCPNEARRGDQCRRRRVQQLDASD